MFFKAILYSFNCWYCIKTNKARFIEILKTWGVFLMKKEANSRFQYQHQLMIIGFYFLRTCAKRRMLCINGDK